MKKRLYLVALLVVTLSSGMALGFWMPKDDTYFALRKNFEIFGRVYEEIVGGYVDELDPEKVMRRGLDAMLQDLDPYTVFIDEADNTNIDIITRGRYGGVGINVGVRNGKITVTSPIEGTSGYKQGVRAGDIIIRLEGQPAENLTLRDMRLLMQGEPGTAVELVVEREGESEPLQFLLTREEVKLKNVTYTGFVWDDTTAGIGYIKLERFARGAGGEVRTALQDLMKTGKLQGIVLDLRDNLGGLLDAAVEITQLFVPEGSEIVATRGRLPNTERLYRSNLAPIAPDLPLVVLVNEVSASASEIVAGAVQDLDRGVVMGMPSFGKGLVQIVRPLPYNTSLKITTSRYYTPSGRSIQAIDYGQHDGRIRTIPDSLRRAFKTRAGRTVLDGRGIEPDLEVTMGEASELEQALDRRAAFFFYANYFAATHPSIAADFEVTDDVLSDFQAWLETQDFSYRTMAERAAASLAENLGHIGYDAAQDDAEALAALIQREKAADFERYADRLKERLRMDIMARYLGEVAQIKAGLTNDPQIKEAVAVLTDETAYAAVLAPQ